MNLMEMIKEEETKDFEQADKVVLTSLSIKNYRSIIEEETTVSPKGIVFTGESGVGKTTRIEALLWLLTGRLFDNSTNGLNEYIMPKDCDKETVLDVTATFDVAGELYVFTKQMKEKWVKKRGTDEVVYEGVDTTYYVNGVKKSTVKDFNSILYRVFGFESAIERIEKETTLLKKVDLIMLFSVLDFFITLDNKTLRELVLLVGGNVDITDLEKSELLHNTLRKYDNSIDDLKKVIKLKLKGDRTNRGLNEQLTTLKAQQEGYQKQIVKLDVPIETKQQELKSITKEIVDITVEMQKGEQDLLRDIETELAQKELELMKRENELSSKNSVNEELLKAQEEHQIISEEYSKIMREIGEHRNNYKSLEQTILFKEGEINSLKERGRDLLAQKKSLSENNSVTCPHCDKPFTLEHGVTQIQTIKEKLFQLQKDLNQKNGDVIDLTATQIALKQQIEILVIQSEVKEEELGFSGNKLNSVELDAQNKTTQAFDDELVLSIKKDIQTLQGRKDDVVIEYAVHKQTIKTKLMRLEEKRDELSDLIANYSVSQTAQKNYDNSTNEIKMKQSEINTIEQLDMEVKLLEEDYLVKIDESLKTVFGENIRFKMFETNMSNENLAPTCEMFVKDSFGRWVNAINGINTGHSVPRLVEFLTIVKHKLGIRDGLLLIDFFESIGNEPLQQLFGYGQQICATQVVRGQNELKTEVLK